MLSRYRVIAIRAALTAFCAGAAVPAAAQRVPSELESWRVPGWSFTPGVAIGAVYDSNVALAGPDVSGNTASDSLLEIEPFGQLEFLSARTTFASGYRGALRRYFELSNLDGVDHNFYATLRHRLTRRVSIFAEESFQQAPTTDALELNGLPFQRVGSRFNALRGGVNARLTKEFDLSSQYELTHVDFVGADVAFRGGRVHALQSSLSRRLGERVSAGGEYAVRFANLNDGLSQFIYQSAGGVLQYRTGERTTLDLAGGITHQIDRIGDLTRTGPYVKAGILHRMERAIVGGEYQRSYSPSFALGGTHRSHEVRGYVDMPFRQNRLYVQESAAWRRTDPFTLEPPLASVWLRSTLGYLVQRWLRLEGYHTLTRQDNRLAGGKVTRQLAGVQLVVSEPMRIR